jgi:FkbM family methyltransferase
MTALSRPIVRYSELGSCMIQGKGTGTGWDIGSEVSVAARLVRTKTPTLLDVGANFGTWSTQMTELFPAYSKLLLVEPQPKCLEAIAKLNFRDSAVCPCAVSDQEGEMKFFTADRKQGWEAASLFERRETYFSEVGQSAMVVRVRKLDYIIAEQGLASIDFMKIDVEGADFLALKGAEANLKNHNIKAMSFEFGSGNINSRTFFRDFWDFLRPLGYSISRILPGGKLLKIEEYAEDLEYFRGVTNYVATIAA